MQYKSAERWSPCRFCVIMMVRTMDNELPKRKSIRLKNYDYSTAGAYFVTICVQGRKRILSEFVGPNDSAVNTTGAFHAVGEDLDPPGMRLKPIGEVVVEQLFALEKRFTNVEIKEHVIMPDHIHAIIIIHKVAGGSRPSPTLVDIMRVFKSLTSRICKQKYGIDRLFQRSYIEHIIRDREDYEARRKYIRDNPIRWYYEKLNAGE